MFKLSKESKITFTGLLIVPLIWIVLNHFGFLDFIEYKSVDLRLKVRGNISHQEGPLADERVNRGRKQDGPADSQGDVREF